MSFKFDYTKIKQVAFDNYCNEDVNKKQIYLHHTAGGPKGEDVFRFWQSDKVQVATCVAISKDGTIVQGFSSSKWAYHLGLKKGVFSDNELPYINLDKISIGIEICNYGPIIFKHGKFVNYVNSVIPDNQVVKLEKPFKGYQYWHNYTDEQIESVVSLLKLWNQKYDIPIDYKDDIWNVTERALSGEMGVFTHNSVRKDKADVYPHPKLIERLKSL